MPSKLIASMESETYLATAVEAAQAAGGFLRANFGRPLTVDENLAHDIKLELDKRTQALIETLILSNSPTMRSMEKKGSAATSPASSNGSLIRSTAR